MKAQLLVMMRSTTKLRAAAMTFVAACLAVTTVAVASPSNPAAAVAAGTSAYSPISPIRVADSRDGFGISSKLASQDTRTLKVVTPAVAAAAGVNAATVTAVAVQVTATQTTGPGHFTVFPADKSRPLASSLNVMRANHTLTNLVSVPVSSNGEIKIFSHSGSHVVVDVQGVFVESNASRAGRLELRTQPTRVVDTRVTWPPDSETSRPPGKLTARSTTVIDLKGTVPESASAVVVNLTSVNNSAQGFLTAFPYGSPLPNASNLNYPDPNLRTAVGSQGYVALKDGKFNVYTLVETDLVVDVTGYFTGNDAPSSSDGLFVPVTPYRMLDTREASNVPPCFKSGRVRSDGVLPVSVASRGGVPADRVAAVAANIALTQTSGPGWARIWPAGGAEPETSSVNSGYVSHTVANHAVTKVSPNGVALRTMSSMHIIVDVTGYFTGPADPIRTVALPDEILKSEILVCTPSESQSQARPAVVPVPSPPPSTDAEVIAADFVAIVNAAREEAGVQPLVQLKQLDDAAAIAAKLDIRRGATGVGLNESSYFVRYTGLNTGQDLGGYWQTHGSSSQYHITAQRAHDWIFYEGGRWYCDRCAQKLAPAFNSVGVAVTLTEYTGFGVPAYHFTYIFAEII